MSSPSTSSSYILPDSPPQRIPNYWQRKAALAAESSAATSAPSPLTLEPPSPSGEIIIGDSPIQRLAPAPTWAPRRAVLATLTNNIKQKQAKRKLVFGDEPEVSGEEEEESIYSQTKKRAVMDHDSSLAPLMKEVEGAGELDFVQLINKPLPKPWIPLRELKEDLPYRIIGAREDTNKHGRREYVMSAFEDACQVDCLYLDLSKAFDRVNHSLLVAKLESYEVHVSCSSG
ncbi:uncharacterized protein LOC120354642 [Nilaparvata lugens]|uniref:uncharacterized protein LOC120354642 n=1 Tax=Nilaparvata lugens TaxID=108931 RepID=UPI00193E9617|nr:uncharacterized protein LOC120354642 [Nilaparvata lugens]